MSHMTDSYYLPTTNINNNNTSGIVDSKFTWLVSIFPKFPSLSSERMLFHCESFSLRLVAA